MNANLQPAPGARRAITPLLAAALVAALALGGCAPRVTPTPPPPVAAATSAPSSAVPTTTSAVPTASPVPTTSPVPVAQASARVYLVRGEYLGLGAARNVTATTPAKGAMLQLLAGPSPAEKTWSLHSEIPAGTTLRGLSIAGGIATVDLSRRFESGGGTLTMTLRIAQVVETLTQFRGVSRVSFRIDGKHVQSIGGEGLMVSPPVGRTDYVDSLAPIMLEEPLPGARIKSPVRLRGSADVFEGQFTARVTDAAGKVIVEQPIHATSGTGTRGTFDELVPFSTAAHGKGWVTVFEPSAKDGSPTNIVRVRVNL